MPCSRIQSPKEPSDNGAPMERDRTKQSKTLPVTETHFRQLVSGVKDYAIFMMDPKGYIISWNEGAQHIKGYCEKEMIGKHFSCFYSEQDRQHKKPQQGLHTALEKGHSEAEGWRIRKDGTRFWANAIITPIKDEQGTLLGFSKVTRDLTERKKNEEQLKHREEQLTEALNTLQTVIQSAPLAIFTTDLNGIVTSWNKTAEHMFGWSANETIGQFSPIVSEKNLKEFETFRQTIYHGKTVVEERVKRRKKDGTDIHVSLSAAPLKDPKDQIIGYLGMIADITEHHEHEQQIAYQKKMLNNVNDAIIATDQNLCITSWNKAAEHIYGWKAEEALGRTTAEVLQGQLSPKTRETKLQQLRNKGAIKGVFEQKRRDGTPIFIEANAMTLTDKQGQFIGYVSVNRDITQRKQAEEARLKAEEALQAQRALSVRANRLRALGEMATGMAHELNQPLQGIQGLSERCLLMAKRGRPPTPNEMLNRFQEILDQTERMAHIITHTRIFAREAHQPLAQLVAPNKVIKSATKLLTSQFRARGVDMVFELAKNLPLVHINPFSLEEVIINLLLNARDAVEDRLKTEPHLPTPHIIIKTTPTPSHVHITITDHGTGISKEIYPHIFEPFFTTKPLDKGTGLGLPISKNIIEQFGGSLNIVAHLGGTTKAIVVLPEDKKTHETQHSHRG